MAYLNIIRSVSLKDYSGIMGISYGSQPSPQLGREKKLLNVFEVVSFPNSPCTTSLAGTNTSGLLLFRPLTRCLRVKSVRNLKCDELYFFLVLPGVCYTVTECAALSGTAGSACASGFGVCCTFTGGEKVANIFTTSLPKVIK